MRSIYIFVLSIFLYSAATDAAGCENGWQAYKDELCIKVFDSFISYQEAKEFCASQGDETSKSSLVMVKDSTYQDLLSNVTLNVFDNLWLGSKYDEDAAEFKWDDGEPLTYTNWQEGYPRNITDPDTCIELRPPNAKISTNSDAKWADVTCQKRNLVMCQKLLQWTLQDAVNEIKRMRTKYEELETRVIPVGSTYVEYYNQPSPPNLWPDLSWEDVTSSYAGLFFRASGGAAEGWGVTQTECAPRITQTGYEFGGSYSSVILPANGWSDYQWVSRRDENGREDGLRFYTTGCEVRPRNQAIRIWKRTA